METIRRNFGGIQLKHQKKLGLISRSIENENFHRSSCYGGPSHNEFANLKSALRAITIKHNKWSKAKQWISKKFNNDKSA